MSNPCVLRLCMHFHLFFFANSLQAVFDQLVIDACCDQPIILMGLKSLDEVKALEYSVATSEYSA